MGEWLGVCNVEGGTVRRMGRVIEVVLGLFFLATAGMKAWNMVGFAVQVSAYGVVKDAGLVAASAYGAVFVETLLGAALVAGARFKGLTYLATAGLTAVFSGLILYGWLAKGIEDCGCFGDFIQMGPRSSLAKNGVLLALLGLAWVGVRRPRAAPKPKPRRLALKFAIAGIVAVLTVGVAGQVRSGGGEGPEIEVVEGAAGEGEFARFRFEAGGEMVDLGSGEYLVALLSATCGHCQASVPGLNTLHGDDTLPKLVALMMGDEAEMADFRALTGPEFITKSLDQLVFMEFMDAPPPRLVYVRDGREVTEWYWEDDTPSVEMVAAGISGAE